VYSACAKNNESWLAVDKVIVKQQLTLFGHPVLYSISMQGTRFRKAMYVRILKFPYSTEHESRHTLLFADNCSGILAVAAVPIATKFVQFC